MASGVKFVSKCVRSPPPSTKHQAPSIYHQIPSSKGVCVFEGGPNEKNIFFGLSVDELRSLLMNESSVHTAKNTFFFSEISLSTKRFTEEKGVRLPPKKKALKKLSKYAAR